MSELLPCPFCGGTDLDTHGDNAIFCNQIGCEAGIDMGHTVGPASRQDVVRRWNTRIAAARIEALEAALREAQQLVTEANNSLYGSQGYFHSLNGGPFNKYHLAEGIETLKASSNRNYHRIEALEKALREIGSVEADPGDGTVKPNLEYVLIRGFSAMGWGQPSLAAHDILALAALAPEQEK